MLIREKRKLSQTTNIRPFPIALSIFKTTKMELVFLVPKIHVSPGEKQFQP